MWSGWPNGYRTFWLDPQGWGTEKILAFDGQFSPKPEALEALEAPDALASPGGKPRSYEIVSGRLGLPDSLQMLQMHRMVRMLPERYPDDRHPSPCPLDR
jgi:hypothetical protein